MNAPEKNLNQDKDFNKVDASVDPNTLISFKNSKKIYISGADESIKVPFR